MKVVTPLPQQDLRLVQSFSRTLEEIGFDGVVGQDNRHDPFIALTAAALATERIQLGTAVAIAFPRSPTVTALQAWDIHAASGGRFYLGLGSQVKGHNERRFGVPWSAPVPRLRDYVGAVRALWRCWEKREPLDYRSDSYTLTLMTPNFMPEPTGLPPPPVTIGAVGPAMLRLAGEVCDGVRLHPFTTRRYVAEFSDALIRQGLERGGRQRSEFEVAAGCLIATGPDSESLAKAREFIRYRIAFYSSTKAYWEVLRLHGLQELGERLAGFAAAGRWSEMAAQIPDEVLDLLGVCAPYDELPDRIEERFGGHADVIELPVPQDATLDRDALARVVERIHAIPCRFRAHRDGWDWTQPAAPAA